MKVVTFGELMLRLAPNGYYRFFQDDQLQATFGGGEANVAVSLANYGMDAAFVTKPCNWSVRSQFSAQVWRRHFKDCPRR